MCVTGCSGRQGRARRDHTHWRGIRVPTRAQCLLGHPGAPPSPRPLTSRLHQGTNVRRRQRGRLHQPYLTMETPTEGTDGASTGHHTGRLPLPLAHDDETKGQVSVGIGISASCLSNPSFIIHTWTTALCILPTLYARCYDLHPCTSFWPGLYPTRA